MQPNWESQGHSGEEDGSDYSIHQFIAKDEARDPEGSFDIEADAVSRDSQRSAFEARERSEIVCCVVAVCASVL